MSARVAGLGNPPGPWPRGNTPPALTEGGADNEVSHYRGGASRPADGSGDAGIAAGSASAATWQDTSIQVTHLHATATNPTAPAVVTGSQGKITVKGAAATDVLSVNIRASRMPLRRERHG